MYSKLQFTVNGEIIEFSAHDLILAANQVIQEKKATLATEELQLPEYQSVDQNLEGDFQSFHETVCANLDTQYGLEEGKTQHFLTYARQVCLKAPSFILSIVTLPRNQAFLNHVKAQTKSPLIDLQLHERIVIPAMTLQPATLNQWMWVARCLKNPIEQLQTLKGWWFNIGGRIIRLRNDVIDGRIPEINKQLYAADHGSVSYILTEVQADIKRCLQGFTWGKAGNFYQAFQFWMYYTLNNLDDLRFEFVERVGQVDLKDDVACRTVFAALGTHGVNSGLLLVEPIVPQKNFEVREQIYRNIFSKVFLSGGQPVAIQTSHDEWMKKSFMSQLTDEMIAAYLSYDYAQREALNKQCAELLQKIARQLFRPNIVPFEQLSAKQKKERGAVFDKIAKEKRQVHQDALRAEFIARMNDDIAASPVKCIRLLMSLGSVYAERRGAVDDDAWRQVRQWFIGERKALNSAEIQNDTLEEHKNEQYGQIFDRLIEDFRYVTEAVLKQRVDAMFNQRLGPFFTQVEQIMHPEDAEKYILAYTLMELAKAVNRGNHEPILREVTAYGDADAGDSYHKFEMTFLNHSQSVGAMSEPELAAKMRQILAGLNEVPEQIAFLPALTAGWFISETARNDLTTMTSLMLLDFIESNVFLDVGNGTNWYTWSHALIHPLKTARAKDVKDLYGQKCEGIDRFGGCHPMVHSGSVEQTKSLPDPNRPLAIARQKEGHLLIHWLERKCALLPQAEKEECGIQAVKCIVTKGRYVASVSQQQILGNLESKKKKRDKNQITIDIKRNNDPPDPAEKYVKANAKLDTEILQLEAQLQELVRIEQIKQNILRTIILPQLRQRLVTLDNLLMLAPQLHNAVVPVVSPALSKQEVVQKSLTLFFTTPAKGATALPSPAPIENEELPQDPQSTADFDNIGQQDSKQDESFGC